jgi:hypothetical protein
MAAVCAWTQAAGVPTPECGIPGILTIAVKIGLAQKTDDR